MNMKLIDIKLKLDSQSGKSSLKELFFLVVGFTTFAQNSLDSYLLIGAPKNPC
jgi:hypothetical protein